MGEMHGTSGSDGEGLREKTSPPSLCLPAGWSQGTLGQNGRARDERRLCLLNTAPEKA